MVKMINEDFFDSVESNEYEDEIEDINNGYDDSESKKDRSEEHTSELQSRI